MDEKTIITYQSESTPNQIEKYELKMKPFG